MNKAVFTLVMACIVAFASLKVIPLLASTYSYMTWQHKAAEALLKDGTKIIGSIKFHSFRCNNYEITNETGTHIVPKDAVRNLSIELTGF